MISIEVAASADDDLGAAVAVLIPQLSRSSPPPSVEELNRIMADPATTLLLAKDDGRVVGMLTLAVFLLPTGVRAWIEDVVVDDDARGSGVASALVQAALDQADQQGARTVDLTSRPEREAANRLYLRLGFERRQTNVYRRTLESPSSP
ncbi:MAG TPA: GNAT family N-acetyltransferase [Acidimicrobiales bacterium]|nr:GNAT family N-acetyltransferase [Acidimicrobiales bacterium]